MRDSESTALAEERDRLEVRGSDRIGRGVRTSICVVHGQCVNRGIYKTMEEIGWSLDGGKWRSARRRWSVKVVSIRKATAEFKTRICDTILRK